MHTCIWKTQYLINIYTPLNLIITTVKPNNNNIITVIIYINMFTPLITYIPSTKSLQFNKSLINHLNNLQSSHFISIVQVKESQLKSFTKFQKKEEQTHGIFISKQFYKQPKKIHYLYLPPNQGKVEQKYQDLLASILITLTNTCIFDISSKYLRQSHEYEGRGRRFNYLVMHTNGGQIYEVEIQSQNNKIQISNKISPPSEPSEPISPQMSPILTQQYRIFQIYEKLNKYISQISHWESYLNFDEIKMKILIQIRIIEHLTANNKDYVQFIENRNMLTLSQIQQIEEIITQFQIVQLSEKNTKLIQFVKNRLISQTKSHNKSHFQLQCILDIKKDHFQQIDSLEELHLKKYVSQNILKEYGITQEYFPILSSSTEISLQSEQISHLHLQISQRNQRISQLSESLLKSQGKQKELMEEVEKMSKKILNFKELNNEYLNICRELEKQRQINRKNKLEIEVMIDCQKQYEEEQKRLKSVIQSLKIENFRIENELMKKQVLIREIKEEGEKLKSENQELNKKIRNFQQLQNRSWRAIEEAEWSKKEMEKYRELFMEIEARYDTFRSEEMKKFNYVLKKNYGVFEEMKMEKQREGKVIVELVQEINGLKSQIEEYRIQLRYCQEQMKG